MAKHNQHHAQPNVLGRDPDIDLGIFAFSQKQGESLRGPFRFLARFQVYTLLPLLALEGFALKAVSVQSLLRGQTSQRLIETALILLHHMAYVIFLVSFLGFEGFLLFATIHHLLAGLYLASVFAPNHKGMLILDDGVEPGFLQHQVMTSRNIRANPLMNSWYGGLNFQIEHHLFPSMPRNNLHRASGIVRSFCLEQGLPYHESGLVASFVEILQHLGDVSQSLSQEE